MSLNLEQQAKLAFDYAKSSELQAKKTQELAQILKQQGQNAASANLIHQYAHAAQQHAQAAQSHALAAQKNPANSTQEYKIALLEHQQELNLHHKAIKEYALFIKNRHSRWQEFSVSTSK